MIEGKRTPGIGSEKEFRLNLQGENEGFGHDPDQFCPPTPGRPEFSEQNEARSQKRLPSRNANNYENDVYNEETLYSQIREGVDTNKQGPAAFNSVENYNKVSRRTCSVPAQIFL